MIQQKAVLREYYARYLTEVRGVKRSTVKHYFDALNNISRRLKEKNLVEQDIYEIEDLNRLHSIREILFNDPDFIEANVRGKRMYSAGLNNYCRFAEGKELYEEKEKIILLDVPVEPSKKIVVKQEKWPRSEIIRAQVIEMAGYHCELNYNHHSFIASKTNKPYMESHHLLPMNSQNEFNVSLDVYANMACLCPLCHKKIHYGLKDERVDMIRQMYDVRKPRLENSGLTISKESFVEVAVGN